MNSLYLIIVFTAVINFLFGLFVLLRGAKTAANTSYVFFTWIVSIWLTFLYLYQVPLFLSSILWIKLVFSTSLLIILPFFYFSFLFPEGKIQPPTFSVIIYVIFWIVCSYFIFFSDLFVKDVTQERYGPKTILGPLFWPAVIITIIYTSWIVFNFIKKFLSAKGVIKLQLKYLFSGAISLSITNFIIDAVVPFVSGTTRHFWFSGVSTLFFTGFTTLAILKYHLFEIRVILTEILVGLMGLILVSEIFIFESLQTKILGLAVFVAYSFCGYLLIKATHREVQQQVMEHERELDQIRREFVAVASHNLRTPLTAIKGYVEKLTQAGENLSQDLKKDVEHLGKSAQELENLTEALLTITKIEKGELLLTKENADYAKLVKEVCERFRSWAEKKRLRFDCQGIENSIYLSLDPEKIKTALENLAENAIEYTQKGEIRIEVEVKENEILTRVSDTGVGIPQENLPSLFQKFYQVGGIRKHARGVGLGLYLTKLIIEAHDGTISVSSTPGQGTTFTLSLPK